MLKKSVFLHKVVPRSGFYPRTRAFTLCYNWNGLFRDPLCGATLRNWYIVRRYAVLEAEWLRKGHFCDQFFTKFNDTGCVCDRESERSG